MTYSIPGKINHVHFLAARVADHIKKGPIVTSADIAQIPCETLVPRAQAMVDTTTSSRRGWLQHDKETTRKWSRPIVRLAARPKPEARPQSGRKAKPAAKRRPGALKTALLATAATTANSAPREVPLVHTQENSNRFLIKVAPEGSLQDFQIPYIGDLINMEPCTLWGKSLLEEREEYAFSGPQARACMGQQPGALSSKRALQPLPTTGPEEEAAFQSGIQMASASWLPFEEVAFTEDMMFSATWSAQNRASQEQKWTFTQILQELNRRLQPLQKQLKMSAVPHQHYLIDINVALVITIMQVTKWQDRLRWTILPASAVSELMMVPIGLQLMPCPPEDEGHIPPVIYGPPVAISSRESGMLRHPSCSKIPIEGGVPEPLRR